jgi:hypothetical protein
MFRIAPFYSIIEVSFNLAIATILEFQNRIYS